MPDRDPVAQNPVGDVCEGVGLGPRGVANQTFKFFIGSHSDRNIFLIFSPNTINHNKIEVYFVKSSPRRL